MDSEPPVTIFVMGVDRWRTEAGWPLPGTQYRPYYLHSAGQANTMHGDGTLSAQPPGREPPDTYPDNPLRPVPTVTGQVILPGANAMGRAISVPSRCAMTSWSTAPRYWNGQSR